MEIAAGLIKVKKGTSQRVEEWRSVMEARTAETLATLQDEGVQIESWFQVEIGGQSYLLWYMRADSIKRVWEVVQQSSHDIDALHFKLMSEITEAEIEAMPLLDLSTDPDGS